MITLHHLENSRSQRVLWLLEELGLPFQVQRYQRNPETMLAPPELKRVHPLGKSPVLVVDGETLAESGAIVDTLLDLQGNGRLRPPLGSAERIRYTYWLHFAEGTAAPFLTMKLVFSKLRSASVPFFIKPILKAVAANVDRVFLDPNLLQQMLYMESELQTRPWFAGAEFSAADIQMSFPLEAAQARITLSAYPALADWLARCQARPAYQRALEVGGPYSLRS